MVLRHAKQDADPATGGHQEGHGRSVVGPARAPIADRTIPHRPGAAGPVIRIAVLLAAASALSPFAAATQPNPEQSGENGECLDFNVLYLTPDLQVDTILVEGGTDYRASQEGGAQIYIDFYDAAGHHIGDNARSPTTTPADATTGTVCVGSIGGGWPDLPALDATWTYQDGF